MGYQKLLLTENKDKIEETLQLRLGIDVLKKGPILRGFQSAGNLKLNTVWVNPGNESSMVLGDPHNKTPHV